MPRPVSNTTVAIDCYPLLNESGLAAGLVKPCPYAHGGIAGSAGELPLKVADAVHIAGTSRATGVRGYERRVGLLRIQVPHRFSRYLVGDSIRDNHLFGSRAPSAAVPLCRKLLLR